MVNYLVDPLITKIGKPVGRKQDVWTARDGPGLVERLVRCLLESRESITGIVLEAFKHFRLDDHSVGLPRDIHVELGLGQREHHHSKKVGGVTRQPAEGHRLLIRPEIRFAVGQRFKEATRLADFRSQLRKKQIANEVCLRQWHSYSKP